MFTDAKKHVGTNPSCRSGIRESAKTGSKTIAKSAERTGRRELEWFQRDQQATEGTIVQPGGGAVLGLHQLSGFDRIGVAAAPSPRGGYSRVFARELFARPDITTTTNTYGDMVTDEMEQSSNLKSASNDNLPKDRTWTFEEEEIFPEAMLR